MRHLRICCLLLAFSLTLAICTAQERKNILLLMADQHRQDAVGAYGNPVVQTPHLDSIAERGLRFTKSYSTTPTCTPARAAILTGLSPWNHGLLGFGTIPQKYPYEMPTELVKNGYHTVVIGKNHFGEVNPAKSKNRTHGYQEEELLDVLDAYSQTYFQWLNKEAAKLPAPSISGNDIRSEVFKGPTKFHPTAWTGERALVHLEEMAASKSPFFMKVSFHRPHSPYDPPQEQWDRYEETQHRIPAAVEAGWEHNWNKTFRRNPPCSGRFGYDCWHGNFGEKFVHSTRRAYYSSVSFIDDQIGRILKKLQDTGLENNTYVLYISDHGDQLGDHFLWRKGYPLESSIRVPTLFMWPKNDSRFPDSFRGRVVDDMIIELRDIFPTILELARIPQREMLDGSSWLAVFRNGTKNLQQKRQYIDLEHNNVYSPSIHWNALTDGNWKYIFWAYSSEEQLFDLRNDPFEMNPLQEDDKYADELLKWRTRMVDHLRIRGPGFVDDEGNLVRREEQLLYSPNLPA